MWCELGFFLSFSGMVIWGNMMGARVVIEVVVGVVVLVLVWWRWSVVWEWVWELTVRAIEERVWWVVEGMSVWLVEELDGGVVAGFLMGFSESSGKTFHTVSHSCLILALSFCRLAWKKEVVKLIEALTDQRVGRSVEASKGLNGLWTGSYEVLMPLLWCEDVLSLQLRWLVGGVWTG